MDDLTARLRPISEQPDAEHLGVYANGSLTYSRPKPEGWGQQ